MILTEYSLFVLDMQQNAECQTIIVQSYKRLTHFNICVYKVMAYLNIANKLEPEVIPFVGNRTNTLVVETNQFLAKFEQDEFALEAFLMNSYVSSLQPSIIYKGMLVTKIEENFVNYTEGINLDTLILLLISKGTDVVTNPTINAYSLHYLNNYVRITLV